MAKESIGQQSNQTEERISAIINKMTLEEKVALLSGKDFWSTAINERLGLPSLVMTDGPHGVRTVPNGDRVTGPATSFPTGIAMASSWNPELIERVGAALGEETHALGCDIILGPCVNIVRHPLAGRTFESYSEDPYQAGRMGIAYVNGVQSQSAGTSLKHFACNNQEFERYRGDSLVDERTLREIYLTAFEMIVKEAKPWTVMCSYNRINGVYASEHHQLMNDILRDEWGFEGIVVSDWTANHTVTESVKAGLDLEMPGPAKYYGKLLLDAVRCWQVDEEVIDKAAARIIRMLIRSGKMDNIALTPASANTPEHQTLARELAEDSIILMKNSGNILPLNPEVIRSIAIIGPTAAEPAISGGGSAHLEPPYRTNPLASIQALAGGKMNIGYEHGCNHYDGPSVVRSEYLFSPDGQSNGLTGEFFNNLELAGEPLLTRKDTRLDFWGFDFGRVEGLDSKNFSARWSGKLKVPADGIYNLYLYNSGTASIYIDGKLILENRHQHGPEGESTQRFAGVPLIGGKLHELRIEFRKAADNDMPIIVLKIDCVQGSDDDQLARAVALASQSDVAIVFVGMPEAHETEGSDRSNLELPGRQNELVKAVTAANPRTVVVLSTGAPVTMPWISDVAAVLQTHFAGQEGGPAATRVLFGEADPGGRLTVTYPQKLEDTPAFIHYPGAKTVHYGEGIFVGYRWYDARIIEPLFPFGHGLSYTAFEYGPATAPSNAKKGEPVKVAVKVTNTGKRRGKEVVQLYVHDKKSSLIRPVHELKGFVKVDLAPGESQTVEFTLEERAFAFFHSDRKEWTVESGEFEIRIGASSRDIRSIATLNMG